MRRFQVKKQPDKDWNDPGPDLLRTRKNARKTIKDDLAEYGAGWYVSTKGPNAEKWSKWNGPFDRAEILDAFDGWEPADKTYAKVGREQADGSGFDTKTVVRSRSIAIKEYSNTSADTDKTIALCEAAFPNHAFGGAFVCKQIAGSSTWSNHAHGKAYDASAYEQNDRVGDWLARMARENVADDIVLPVWQILGSKDGKVVSWNNADGDWIGSFERDPSSADDSHLWHCHIDTGKKDPTGTPACASKTGPLDPIEDPHPATDDEEE